MVILRELGGASKVTQCPLSVAGLDGVNPDFPRAPGPTTVRRMPDAVTQPAATTRSRSIQDRAAAFRTSHAGRATWQMISTLVPLAIAFALMFWGMSNAWWLTILLLPLTALLFVRTFIIMHDCSHGSFTGSKRANEIIGFITGVLLPVDGGQSARIG